MTGSSLAFGDIDNDGDLDLAVSGEDNYDDLIFKIYTNNGASLVENQTWQSNLTGIRDGSIAFGDIDNDGDLDMVAMGCDSGEVGQSCASYASKIYINNGTVLIENSTWQQNFSSFGYKTLGIGDIDNDGDIDMAMSGGSNDFSVYINNESVFTENDTWSQNIRSDLNNKELYRGGIIFGDIDNDNDLDLVITGFAQVLLTRIYVNNGTTLIRNTTWDNSLSSLQYSSLAFGDYDNDGLTDLVLMGRHPDSTNIYRNNGTTFLENQTGEGPMVGMYDGGIAWGDYDNDGDLDLAQSGQPGYTLIYINNNTVFRDAPEEENVTNLDPNIGIVTWIDIDNDNDLDFLISGWVTTFIKVYINNITSSNSAPTPPVSFSYNYEDRNTYLGWGNGSDNETPSAGLYYNLRIGTASNNNSIISGVYGGSSNPTAGYFGNMMQRKNFTLKVDRLQANTTYFWSVQSIDTGLKPGSWSAQQNFTTPSDMVRPDITLNSPVEGFNSSSYTVVFNVTVADLNLTNVSLYGSWGGWHLNETNSSGLNMTYIFTRNLTGYGDGNYTWQIKAMDNATHMGNSAVRTFTIDTTAPNVGGEVKSLATVYANTDVRLNATINDSLVGLSVVWISVNITGLNYTVSSSEGVYSFLLASGNYSKNQNITWKYYANDSSGNEQAGSFQSFVVANSVPVLSGVPDNSTNEDTTPPDKWFNLSAYASDADSDSLTFAVQSQGNASLINCSISASYYLNCSQPVANQSGASTIVVNVTDSTNYDNDTFIVTVSSINDIPWLTGVNLTADSGNRTNATLTGDYTFNDVESAGETDNETKWYKNGIVVESLANLTSVSAGNTTKRENWTFSVRAYDGSGWSVWYNSSDLTIANSAPNFSSMANQSWVMNSNLSLNLSLYFTDMDSDTLAYTNTTVKNISMDINQTTSVVTFVPDSDWNGTSFVVFTANDSEDAAESNNITLEVFKPIITYSEFDGDTTNFSNLTSFINVSVIIEKGGFGKISFDSVSLNKTSIDINTYVNISDNRIEVDSSSLPEFNSSATLYFYNLTYNNPRPLRSDVACPSMCTEVSYSSGMFVYNVTSFTVYSSEETPSGNGGTGGGGGGGRGVAIVAEKFSIDVGEVRAIVTQGETEKARFSITNIDNKNITVSLSVEDIAVFLPEETFTLLPQHTKIVTLNFISSSEQEPSTYMGRLLIKSDSVEKSIPLIMEVKRCEALFDVKIDIPDRLKAIFPGEDITAEIELTNLGKLGRVDVLVNSFLTDASGNVIDSAREILAVETVASFVRSFSLAPDIEPGDYEFNINLTYKDVSIASSQSFKVKQAYPFLPAFVQKRLKEIVLMAMAIAIVIIIIILIRSSLKEKILEKREKRIEKEVRRLKRARVK